MSLRIRRVAYFRSAEGGDAYMTGNQIFWQSGTWCLFAGQLLVLLLIVSLYFYMGKKEKDAKHGK